MGTVLGEYMIYRKSHKQGIKVHDYAQMLRLGERFQEVSKGKVEEIKEAHSEVFWGVNPRERWRRLMNGDYSPNWIEAHLFCQHLHCTIEEFSDPHFSFGDREAEMRKKQVMENALVDYGINLDESQAA